MLVCLTRRKISDERVYLHQAVVLLLPDNSDGALNSVPWRAVNGRVQRERLLAPVRRPCRVWCCGKQNLHTSHSHASVQFLSAASSKLTCRHAGPATHSTCMLLAEERARRLLQQPVEHKAFMWLSKACQPENTRRFTPGRSPGSLLGSLGNPGTARQSSPPGSPLALRPEHPCGTFPAWANMRLFLGSLSMSRRLRASTRQSTCAMHQSNSRSAVSVSWPQTFTSTHAARNCCI